jgi:NADH:ubiquinone reductase (non-electrogenic)
MSLWGCSLLTLADLLQSGVRLVRGVVKDVQSQKIMLNDGTEVPYGLLVWSTGVGPSPFSRSLKLPTSPGGRYSFLCVIVF